jgi:hypothetical protein
MPEHCKRWDAVQIKDHIRPMIYISPNDQLKNKNEGDIIDLMITNSKSIYDNKKISGILVKNCNIPSYRPNYSEQSGYYTIVLNVPWITYPEQNGEVKFDHKDVIIDPIIGSKSVINAINDADVKEGYKTSEKFTPKNKKCTRCTISGMVILQIILIVIVIVTVILLLIFSPKK